MKHTIKIFKCLHCLYTYKGYFHAALNCPVCGKALVEVDTVLTK